MFESCIGHVCRRIYGLLADSVDTS